MQKEKDALVLERTEIQSHLRHAPDDTLQQRHVAINERLKEIRSQIRSTQGIQERSSQVKKNIQNVMKDRLAHEQVKQTEKVEQTRV